jgi:NAD(P)-dependent dehydrogenase (short-subunit alcohol dehydrogenase family)
MRICVIDGQGGGIGAALIKRLKEVYQEEHEVIALGTNAVATAQMMKARANRGASGENAICRTVLKVDVILGCLSIVLANSMMGEVTPRMAEAIASSPAPKILLPLTQEKVEIVGLSPEPLPHLVEKIVSHRLKEILRHV